MRNGADFVPMSLVFVYAVVAVFHYKRGGYSSHPRKSCLRRYSPAGSAAPRR